MRLKQLLDARLAEAMRAAGAPDDAPALLDRATRPEFGDFQANGVMAAAKKLKTNPRALAQKVLECLDLSDIAETVEIAGPGFINIRLRNDSLAGWLNEAAEGDRLGVAESNQPQTVVVDYSHPNLAKEMHVGHLRSTIIGDGVVRVLEFLGHRVIRHNHVGDWGTQFGMLLAYMDRRSTDQQVDVVVELADLEEFYRAAKRLFDSDESFAATSREYVVNLQAGDARIRDLWRRFTDESLGHCERVYERLNISLTHADLKPESSYNDDLPRVVEALRSKGLLTESRGAQCVFLEGFKGKDGEPLPVIIQKSDGGYLYTTTDLAAIRFRAGELGADRILYIVDARQTLHLQQVFAVSRAAGFVESATTLEHHAFGTMMGQDGRPFKTREGGTIKLMDMLAESERRAYDLVSEKSPDLSEEDRREIGRVVGMGAVKYADLSQNRTSDYVFSWDKMLALQGNTAPYMQYAYARVRSIFRKGNLDPGASTGEISVVEPAERILALGLLYFGEVVESVARDGYPHILCSYLYEIAGSFMSFYESCPVLKAEEPVRTSRLMLADLTARTIRTGLSLIGIETIEKM